MEQSLFRYVWRHSRRDQLVILALVAASLPFYFMSLDLPRSIVNNAIQGRAYRDGHTTAPFLQLSFTWPDFLGGGTTQLFSGFELTQVYYLFGLSGLFLFFVLVNGAFKYVINLKKGALGERMLRRLRFDLFTSYLRFKPESIRGVKAAEAATVIKDEVEPIGGFIGDAFVQPAFLGGQALTAMVFILVQNVWLGLVAAGVVGVQAFVIPRLRREQIRLGKMRQIASRKLAGRVGEVVDGMAAVRAHGTAQFEQAEIGSRLGELFTIRYDLFKRKFAVKYLNNLLAQVTPFLFYTIGGYLALKGQMDIGQLVAVIAAYRDLPPPIKELIDWDQQRLDVTVKYDQIIEQVASQHFAEPEDTRVDVASRLLSGAVDFQSVGLHDARGNPLLEGASFNIRLPRHVAVVGGPSSGASSIARILGRDVTTFTGHARIAGIDLLTMPAAVAGLRLGFAGADPVIFPGSIRDNILYGLRQKSLGRQVPPEPMEDSLYRREAQDTGNPIERPDDEWIDYDAIGATGPDDVDDRIIETLMVVGMDDAVYRFGLGGTIDPGRYPELSNRIVDARRAVHAALAQAGESRLVEPFDPRRYNANATVAENLLFGVPLGDTFREANLATNPFVRSILEAEGLTRPLTEAGLQIAETMVEIFSGLPPGHSMFERFSFISADDLPEYAELVARWKSRRRGPDTGQDRDRLIALPLIYIEPRHRLGVLDDDLRERVVRARESFARLIPASLKPAVEFYDPDTLCSAAPVRDNLLFGRIAYGIANANDVVLGRIRAVLREMGLEREVYRLGLDYQVGPAGRLLFGMQKAAVHLARCLVKRPDIMVVQDALATYGDQERRAVVDRMLGQFKERSLWVTIGSPEEASGFPTRLILDGTRIKDVVEQSEPKPEPVAEAAK